MHICSESFTIPGKARFGALERQVAWWFLLKVTTGSKVLRISGYQQVHGSINLESKRAKVPLAQRV